MNDRFQNLTYAIFFAIMVGWILHIGRSIFIPVAASIISVYVLLKAAEYLSYIPVIGRLLPGWLRHVIVLLLFALGVFFLVLLMSSNIERVIQQAPQYQANLLAFIEKIAEFFDVEDQPTWDSIRRLALSQINFQSFLAATITSVSALAGQVFVVFLYAGFLLAERAQFQNKIRLLATNPENTKRMFSVIRDINSRIGDYLAAKTLVNIVLGAASYVIMLLIGIDFAGFWAVLIGVFNYVPYVGSMLGVMFPVMLAIVQFGTFDMILIALIGLTLVQMFVGSVLEPRIMGRTLNLSPFVILVTLTVWYSIWGIAGAILAVPMTSVVAIICAAFASSRWIAVMLSSDGKIPTNGEFAPEPKTLSKAES